MSSGGGGGSSSQFSHSNAFLGRSLGPSTPRWPRHTRSADCAPSRSSPRPSGAFGAARDTRHGPREPQRSGAPARQTRPERPGPALRHRGNIPPPPCPANNKALPKKQSPNTSVRRTRRPGPNSFGTQTRSLINEAPKKIMVRTDVFVGQGIRWTRGGGGCWHKASVFGCVPLAAPIGLSPLHILTLCGSERVLVVSTEPPDDLSCLTTPGLGCPGDGAVARAVDPVHPDAPSESMRGFADSSTDLCAGGGGLRAVPRHPRIDTSPWRPVGLPRAPRCCGWLSGRCCAALGAGSAPPMGTCLQGGARGGRRPTKHAGSTATSQAAARAPALGAQPHAAGLVDEGGGGTGMHRKGTDLTGGEAVRQAVGGGCQSGSRRLLSVTNPIEAGTCRQGDSGWA